MFGVAQRSAGKWVAAAAAAGLVLTPAIATSMPTKKKAPSVALSFDPVASFTPANADPKLAAALAGKGLALTDFKFTPAPAKGRPSQVRVAIRARVMSPAQTRLAEAAVPTAAVRCTAIGPKRKCPAAARCGQTSSPRHCRAAPF